MNYICNGLKCCNCEMCDRKDTTAFYKAPQVFKNAMYLIQPRSNRKVTLTGSYEKVNGQWVKMA